MMIADTNAADAMRLLALGINVDQPVVAGEPGVAGLAGFLAVADDRTARQKLGTASWPMSLSGMP